MNIFLGIVSLVSLCVVESFADSSVVTLIHTNDLHSRYHPNPHPPYLGGVARLKTVIQKIRKENPNSLLLDAGDFTEGQIYYNLEAGVENYRMMQHLGYDMITLGNHDFLNGPEVLLDVIKKSHLKTEIIGSNLGFENFQRAHEFQSKVRPYFIKEIQGVKLGFIGLLTYEFIYNKFLKPLLILDPLQTARDLSMQLKTKERVDYIIALSHNRTSVNREILKNVPDLDLIIGAHDHLKYSQPILVERSESEPGLIVEAGKWGEYIGKLQLRVSHARQKNKVEPLQYELIPVERKISEDSETKALLRTLDEKLGQKYGSDFHEKCVDNPIELLRDGFESPIGHLVTDAFRDYAKSDIAIDHPRFIYGTLPKGKITPADVMNVLPAVYNPITNQAWTLKTLTIQGSTLNWILNLLLSSKKIAEDGSPTFSGLEAVFQPVFGVSHFPLTPHEWLSSEGSSVVKRILVQGSPLSHSKKYRVAMSGGIYETLQFLNSLKPSTIPFENLEETGVESWKVLLKYIKKVFYLNKIPPEILDTLKYRLKTSSPDLSILPTDVSVKFVKKTEQLAEVKLKFKIRNLGLTSSRALNHAVALFGHGGIINPVVEINSISLRQSIRLPAIEPGGYYQLEEYFKLPRGFSFYPLIIRVKNDPLEVHTSNNELIYWLEM